jgi:YHS domain-containing protein
MVNCPVCGMQVDPMKTRIKSVSMGQTHYFRSAGDKKMFDRQPEKHAKQGQPAGSSKR